MFYFDALCRKKKRSNEESPSPVVDTRGSLGLAKIANSYDESNALEQLITGVESVSEDESRPMSVKVRSFRAKIIV